MAIEVTVPVRTNWAHRLVGSQDVDDVLVSALVVLTSLLVLLSIERVVEHLCSRSDQLQTLFFEADRPNLVSLLRYFFLDRRIGLNDMARQGRTGKPRTSWINLIRVMVMVTLTVILRTSAIYLSQTTTTKVSRSGGILGFTSADNEYNGIPNGFDDISVRLRGDAIIDEGNAFLRVSPQRLGVAMAPQSQDISNIILNGAANSLVALGFDTTAGSIVYFALRFPENSTDLVRISLQGVDEDGISFIMPAEIQSELSTALLSKYTTTFNRTANGCGVVSSLSGIEDGEPSAMVTDCGTFELLLWFQNHRRELLSPLRVGYFESVGNFSDVQIGSQVNTSSTTATSSLSSETTVRYYSIRTRRVGALLWVAIAASALVILAITTLPLKSRPRDELVAVVKELFDDSCYTNSLSSEVFGKETGVKISYSPGSGVYHLGRRLAADAVLVDSVPPGGEVRGVTRQPGSAGDFAASNT